MIKTIMEKLIGLAIIGCACLLLTGTASAQSSVEHDAAAEGRQFSDEAGEIVNDALILLNSNQYEAALSKLNEALALLNLNAYERSTIYQMQGSSYYELNQYEAAILAFENAIDAGGLLPREAGDLSLNIGQLYIASDQHAKGTKMLDDYREQHPISPQHMEVMMGHVIQAGNYQSALPLAEHWFDEANPKERKHFDVLHFLYQDLGMTEKQADILEQMIVLYPQDKTLWETWASLLANNDQDEDAFEVYKMLYLGGFMNDDGGLVKIVKYYDYFKMPYQAARILEREMNAGRIERSEDNLTWLADLLSDAREFDRAFALKAALAKEFPTSQRYADLGDVAYRAGQWAPAEQAWLRAIELGYDDVDEVWLRIGEIRYNLAKRAKVSCLWSFKLNRHRAIYEEPPRILEAFDKVRESSAEWNKAQAWKSRIEAEQDGPSSHCNYAEPHYKELCFHDIKGAYDNMVFTGGKFELSDPDKCTEAIPEYDLTYRFKKEP